jgi:hypothetical protein
MNREHLGACDSEVFRLKWQPRVFGITFAKHFYPSFEKEGIPAWHLKKGLSVFTPEALFSWWAVGHLPHGQ